jgi:hypothetical protein
MPWVGRQTLWTNRDAYGPGAEIIVPGNAGRQGLKLFNNTGVTISPRGDGMADATSFDLQMVSGAYYEWPAPIPAGPISVYVGAAIAVATINITETMLVWAPG